YTCSQHSLTRRLFPFHAPAPTEIYTLSLHDALPISRSTTTSMPPNRSRNRTPFAPRPPPHSTSARHKSRTASARKGRRRSNALRSEEHTSELQSLAYLVCRLLLEKKNNNKHKQSST